MRTNLIGALRCARRVAVVNWFFNLAQPALLVEEPERHDDGNEHQRQRERVTVLPVDLGKPVFEVHAVDAGDQGRRQHGHRRHGKDFDNFVLVVLFGGLVASEEGGEEETIDEAFKDLLASCVTLECSDS